MSMENPTWVTGTLDTTGGGINLASVAPHLFAPPPVVEAAPVEVEAGATVAENVTGEVAETSGTEALGVPADEAVAEGEPESEEPAPEGETAPEGEAVAADEAVAEGEGEGEEPGEPEAEAFDPSEYTVAEVLGYLATASDEEKARVLAAEAAGRNRKTIVE